MNTQYFMHTVVGKEKKYGMVLGVRPQRPNPRVRDTVTRQILACLNTPSVQKKGVLPFIFIDHVSNEIVSIEHITIYMHYYSIVNQLYFIPYISLFYM